MTNYFECVTTELFRHKEDFKSTQSSGVFSIKFDLELNMNVLQFYLPEYKLYVLNDLVLPKTISLYPLKNKITCKVLVIKYKNSKKKYFFQMSMNQIRRVNEILNVGNCIQITKRQIELFKF